MNKPENWESGDRQPLICPFLGLADDSETALSFPSQQNRCYHSKNAQKIRLTHQRAYCLTTSYTSCEEYQSEAGSSSALIDKNKRIKVPGIKPVVWIYLIAVVAVAIITWQMISRGLFGFGMPGNAPVSSPPVVLVTGSSPTLAPIQVSPTPTATSLPTETPFVPLPTDSPTQVSFHGLETPIGTDQNIIIHMVQSGESLVSIASHFWTTTDAIIAVNFQLQLPLQVDKVIVIPNNQTDVQGWPAFEVYNVPEDIVVETLAQQLGVKPDLLKLYNGFSDGEIVRAGDWVLVPHIGTAVP